MRAAVLLTVLAQVAARHAKNNISPARAGETCVFLLATPGSGSSTMVELLSRAGVEMSGENWGAFIGLARFDERMRRTARQPRPTNGPTPATCASVCATTHDGIALDTAADTAGLPVDTVI